MRASKVNGERARATKKIEQEQKAFPRAPFRAGRARKKLAQACACVKSWSDWLLEARWCRGPRVDEKKNIEYALSPKKEGGKNCVLVRRDWQLSVRPAPTPGLYLTNASYMWTERCHLLTWRDFFISSRSFVIVAAARSPLARARGQFIRDEFWWDYGEARRRAPVFDAFISNEWQCVKWSASSLYNLIKMKAAWVEKI